MFVTLVCLLGCSKKSKEEISLTPSDSLKAMHLSDDFHPELFAAEPDVMSPVEMVFDENGKVYVAEMLDYPDDPPAGKPARSRVRLLVDADGDGKYEKNTIFAGEVLAVSGILPWKGGLIVTSAPDIWWMQDTDGDGKADVKKKLFTGFPRSNQEGRITNPRLGVDNWIYCSNAGNDGKVTSPDHPEYGTVLVRGTDFRFDPVSGRMEAASGPAQFGSTFDDFGNRYISQNTTHIRHVVVPMKYLARAPLLEVRGVAQDISDHGRPSARMYPLTGPQEWRKERTALRQKRYDENKTGVTEQVGGWFTAASGGTLYNGDAFPAEYAGSVFTGDVSGNLIHRDTPTPDGATMSAHRAKDEVEFLASTDIWFRPCNFMNAPDGNLYVTDIYRQVIETPESIPEEIRKKINFYNGDTMGRIYRIVPNHPRRKGDLKPGLGAKSSTELVAELANPNGWHRWTAHRLLLERQDKSAVPALRAMASNAMPEARVHALWLLAGLGALTADDAARAMKDADSRVRSNAIEMSEPLVNRSQPLASAMLAAAADADSRVEFQAALSLGGLKDARAMSTLAALAHAKSADPWFRVAILSSVADSASPFYHLLAAKGDGWVDAEMMVGLSSLIGARQNPAELAKWFGSVARAAHPERQVAGLARGLRMSNARGLKVAGAEQAITKLLANPSEPVQQAAWEASRYFELTGLLNRASKEAADANLPLPRRVLAIRALRGGRFDATAPILKEILHAHPAPEVEVAAVDSLASFDEPAVAEALLENWRGYGPDARRHAVGALLGQKGRIPVLLAAVESGRVERSAVDANARAYLYDNSDAAIRTKAKALLETASNNRTQVVARYQDVLKLTGDVARGKQVFETTCAKCHMPRKQGGRVGPDLSGINNKTKDELLTSILNPSYAIEPRFVNYVVTTKDGRMYDGVIANETPGSITLRGGSEEGDETILRKNVAEIRASAVSLMPEGLEDNLKKQDIADVIAYLRGGL